MVTLIERESTDGVYDGTWSLENDLVRVVVNPERGGDILSLVWKGSDTEVLWRNPRTDALPPIRGDYDLADSSYFDNYPGGIQEIFPNAGAATEVWGARLPFHGEALRRPWSVMVEGDSLVCRTALARYPFRMQKRFSLAAGSSVLRFSSRIENVSSRDLPVHWGLHPTFNTRTVAAAGRVYGSFESFVAHPERFSEEQAYEPGAVIDAAPVSPGVRSHDLAPGDGHTADLAYATVRTGWFGLRSPGIPLLATMTWPVEIFPELWVWQECHAPGGYPWWGTEHIVGVEPQTASPFRPLAEEAADGAALIVRGGQILDAEFTLGVQPIGDHEHPTGIGPSGTATLNEETR